MLKVHYYELATFATCFIFLINYKAHIWKYVLISGLMNLNYDNPSAF